METAAKIRFAIYKIAPAAPYAVVSVAPETNAFVPVNSTRIVLAGGVAPATVFVIGAIRLEQMVARRI